MDFSYNCLCIAAFLARFIPLRLGYFLAERTGDAVFYFSAKRRRNVYHNIRCALGTDIDDKTLRQKARSVFRNTAKNHFDSIKLSRMDLAQLNSKVEIEGAHHMLQAVENKKGVIIATAHLGNFEFGASIVASRGFEMMILVEAFDSKPFLRKLAAMRQRKGIRILPIGIQGMKEAILTLRRGGIVTIVCDRDIKGNGFKTTFVGQETSLPVGVIDLAYRTGALIVPIFSLRAPGNATSVFIEPPLELADMDNYDRALHTNMNSLSAVLERYIRKYPEQWLVLQPLKQP